MAEIEITIPFGQTAVLADGTRIRPVRGRHGEVKFYIRPPREQRAKPEPVEKRQPKRRLIEKLRPQGVDGG